MEKKMVAYDVKHESFNVNPPSEIPFLARNFDLDSFFLEKVRLLWSVFKGFFPLLFSAAKVNVAGILFY